MSLPTRTVAFAGLLAGCDSTRDELTAMVEGPALWPVVLTTVASVDELTVLEGGFVVTLLGDVRPAEGVLQAGVTAAEVSVETPDATVEAVEDQPGVYVTPVRQAGRLVVGEGEPVTVRAWFPDGSGSVTGHGARPFVVDLPLERHVAGEDLTIDLPDGYDARYDQVLVQVYGLDGETTWSTLPARSRGWLELLLFRHTPPDIVIPGSAFPEADTLYALAVFGLDRVEPGATVSGDLHSVLSGFSAGAAVLLPVLTRP